MAKHSQLSFAFQNSPSSMSMRRARSSMKSVSASYWLSGKQTPSSVLSVQSKSFQNLLSITGSYSPLQGEWNVPPSLLSEKVWRSRSAGRDALGSVSRYNLRVTSGVVMCQCGLYIPSHVSVPHTDFVSPLPTCICFLKESSWCAGADCAHLFPNFCSIDTHSLKSAIGICATWK